MNMLLNLAWRNIWRNKRRTIITMASIIFAVLLAILLNSIKEGVLFRLQENVVSFYTGPIQIHKSGYWDEKTLDNSFEFDPSFTKQIEDKNGISTSIERIESYALAASDNYTKVCMIVGINPEKEPAVTGLDKKIIYGNYITENGQEAMLSEGLASYLRLSVGDTLIIIGQGYHGQSAAGKFPVAGIVKFASPDLNKRMVYLNMKTTQKLFGMEGRLTALVLAIDNINNAEKLESELAAVLPTNYEVMSWKKLMPELNQIIEGERAENDVFLFILYLLIAFGIFGTVLMMTIERQYEFGVLVAIGMRRLKLSSVVIMENITISIMGAFFGTLLSVPIVSYFYFFPIYVSGDLKEAYESFGFEPIFYFSIEPKIFYSQTIVVLCIALVLSIYPLLKIMRLEAVEAMRA